MDFLPIIGLGIVVFVSTNIDDIFVLMLFFADPTFNARQVIIGQYVGIALLTGFSALGALVALVIPPQIVGIMGLLPIAIGISKLRDLRQPKETQEMMSAQRLYPNAFLSVTLVTISNGTDNIAVYVPVFANSTLAETVILILVFMGMIAVWCAVAYYLIHHSFMGRTIRRVGNRILPFVLIALGLYILAEAFL